MQVPLPYDIDSRSGDPKTRGSLQRRGTRGVAPLLRLGTCDEELSVLEFISEQTEDMGG